MENLSKNEGDVPAGSSLRDGGQQPEGVIIQNARDERVMQWLRGQASLIAIESACKQLGRRHPYPSNIAKTLGLNPPEHLQFTPSKDAKEHLNKAKSALRGIKCK